MSTKPFQELPKIVHDLADAFSNQSKHSNRVWLALVAAAMLTLFPNIDSADVVTLPFSLGSVDVDTYKIVGFLIVTILMISYCQAYARAHLAVQFAHKLIEKLGVGGEQDRARRLFDNLIIPTFARTSALAELTGMAKVAAIYYCLLKLVANIVVFVMPSYALIRAYIQLASAGSIPLWGHLLLLIALCVTSFAVLQVMLVEMNHTRRVAALYWRGRLTGSL